jgi:hypothetical protein
MALALPANAAAAAAEDEAACIAPTANADVSKNSRRVNPIRSLLPGNMLASGQLKMCR